MKIGAQTFTIRDYMQNERDFRESMRRLSAIGYTCVQLSGVGDVPVEAQRDSCGEYGLQVALTHTNPDRIINDTDAVIREHELLGCNYIGIGMMAPRYQTAEWIDRFSADFLTPAKKIRDAGKKLVYHNHNLEWTRLRDGRKIFDVMLTQMPAELMGLTLDMYWVQAAGADVLATVDSLQDRIPCVHLKDMAVKGFEQRMAVVGEGNMDYERILAHLQALGKTEYAFVEQDNCYGESPFDCLARSLTNIKRFMGE